MILIAVLDWGLGHAGRSIPLIAEFRRQGAQVLLAGSGGAGLLLREAYPDLPFLECPSYHIHYRGRNMYWNMLLQLPKIFRAVAAEHYWLKRMIRSRRIDAVISDCRFGCYHPEVPSVMINHQLHLRLHPEWLSGIVQAIYRWWLRRFDAIWVPDQPDGLSGALSYPSPFAQTHYIGLLSRFKYLTRPPQYDLLVLLSGPEPQRTILEQQVLHQLKRLPRLRVLLVQGKTDQIKKTAIAPNIDLVSYLSGAALQEAIAGAGVVLCRSGYSSLMDLARMRKSAILVPTPGQPEQEYLAQRCEHQQWATVSNQQVLDVEDVFGKASHSNRKIPDSRSGANDSLRSAVERFLFFLEFKEN